MLILQPDHLTQITNHAQACYPQECCGLLLGVLTADAKEVKEVRETANSWSPSLAQTLPFGGKDRRERFFIAPEVLLALQKEARDRQLNVVGIYHSHPDHPPIPSEYDRLLAWPEYSYLIIGLDDKQVREVLSWHLNETGDFIQEVWK